MKKLLIAFTGLLSTALIVLTVTSWGLPKSDSFTPVYWNDNSTLGVETRITESYVYKIQDDKITSLYLIPALSDGNATSVLSACYDGDILYILRDYPQNNLWQILTLAEKNTFTPVTKYPFDEGDTLLEFRVEKSKGFITLRDTEGNVKVYIASDIAKGDWALLLLQEAPSAGIIEKAKYLGGSLYLLTSGGQELSVTAEGVSSFSDEQFFDAPEVSELKIPFRARLGSKSSLFTLVFSTLAFVFIPLIISEAVRRKTSSFTTRTSALVISIFTITLGLICGVFTLYTAFTESIAVIPGLITNLLILYVLSVLVTSALFIFVMKRSMKPMIDLSVQMSRVADGDYAVAEVADSKDEVGIMGRSLQEMCVSLSIRDYEVNSTMLSYHRFVPCGLEQLLDRASITEVSLGDSRAISGNTGIFTVCNRQAVRLLLSDDDYVSFVNRSSALIDSTVRFHNGLLLSSGYDMSGNRVFFRGESNNGVKAGLDLLGAAAEFGASEQINPKFFLLLHKTVFLYGIAGSADNMFPYISSSELEFLGSYSDRLKSAGAQIVMTEPYLQQLGGNCVTRYIGFVSSEDYQISFKLYEVLDAYSDLERNLRISYDQRLQEAITLFYKSDFYLARNLFSNILRVCPSDGIALWYLFACEHFFHAADGEEPNFQLFGVNFD